MLFNQDQSQIYSANFDTGSVSIIDAQSGKIIKEQTLGRDIRRIALSDDGKLLLATDHLNDQVLLLASDSLTLLKRIKVPSRPFGVVFDLNHQQFYVSSFEAAKLLTISIEGELIGQLDVEQTPRGMALTADQRLLLTHAMTGQVSILDVSDTKPRVKKVIQLADTPTDEVLTNPQGKPRLLDNIALSPDGKTAWLPHVLWSFGHDFQFQSTVFPALSLIDLTQEQELTSQRKLLFKQINILESGNKVRIVSNPHDGVFSDDGNKLIISMAGSEDLLVFDLSRQGKKNKRRHRRKKFQGGVKATQIYRNVPGDNPRALLLKGRELLVQNAMSLNIAKFDIGQPGPFSKLKLTQADFAALVSFDPLSANQRLGKTLFNRANSADDKQYPMTGDFWMSCNSCHFDGFNFTNKHLMADGVAAKDKYQNAVTGHVDTIKMVAGDPIGAYIEMIQTTQGGMGAEPGNDKVSRVDINDPPFEVFKMMLALDSYVRAPQNLPYLSTWLRLDDDKKYTHPREWLNSAQCQDCHKTVYDQWADSNHGMNMDHPFYRFVEDQAAKAEGEPFRLFCRGCHTPQMVLSGDNQPLTEFGDPYEQQAKSLEQAYEQGIDVNERGTGCVFCHRVTKAEDAGGNADLTVNLKDREGYLFETRTNSLLRWLSHKQINAAPKAHKASYSNPQLYQSALYCAGCHNEFTPGPGAVINDNYGEWLASPFNRPEDPEQHKSCIDCHMTMDTSDFDHRVAGQSTENGPIKQDMRSHHFSGGNYYLAGMRSLAHKKLSVDLLKNALSLAVEKQAKRLTAKVTNVNSGHDMPGGSRRQVWLEVIATDANGKRVFESGVMQDGYIPADARRFIKIGVDKAGNSVGLHAWRYSKIAQDTRIRSGQTREELFELPEAIEYPLTVSTRVLYQVFAKSLTEQVRAAYPQQVIPEPEVIELNKVVKTFNQ